MNFLKSSQDSSSNFSSKRKEKKKENQTRFPTTSIQTKHKKQKLKKIRRKGRVKKSPKMTPPQYKYTQTTPSVFTTHSLSTNVSHFLITQTLQPFFSFLFYFLFFHRFISSERKENRFFFFHFFQRWESGWRLLIKEWGLLQGLIPTVLKREGSFIILRLILKEELLSTVAVAVVNLLVVLVEVVWMLFFIPFDSREEKFWFNFYVSLDEFWLLYSVLALRVLLNIININYYYWIFYLFIFIYIYYWFVFYFWWFFACSFKWFNVFVFEWRFKRELSF